MVAGPRVIFLDIDETLVDHFGCIPPSATAAIRLARRRGSLVMLATGRSLRDIWPEVLDIGFDGVVAASGAHVTVGDDLVLERCMPDDQVERVSGFLEVSHLGYCLQSPEATFVSDRAQGAYEAMVDELVDEGASRQVLEAGTFKFLHASGVHQKPSAGRVTKIAYLAGGAARCHAAREFPELDVFATLHVTTEAGEMVAKGVSKALGLSAALAHVGGDAADAVAVGDSHNDLEMLALVGVGVAMGNATPDVLAAADLVVETPQRNGVEHALGQLGLLGGLPVGSMRIRRRRAPVGWSRHPSS